MTKQTQATPGPWRYVRANPSPTTGEHLIAGAKPGYLAEVRDCGSGDVMANALLIAAAPDLRDALRGVLEILPIFPKNTGLVGIEAKYEAAVVAARAALARTTGE